jgi:hypothetical protein
MQGSLLDEEKMPQRFARQILQFKEKSFAGVALEICCLSDAEE